ncbi:MAG TPA: hypothetical protein VL026_14935 [Rhizomicrobium sp.]|nr:hypothetical protein [Rhizomicrobium sp.]
MLRNAILMTVSALAMLSAPAFADDLDFAGALTGQYSHVGSDLPDANVWSINGAAKIGLGDTGLNAELDVGHNHLSISSVNVNNWNVGGALFYKVEEGRVGANVNYTEIKTLGVKAHATNYGGFGEYFASDMFTLGGKLGGFSGDANGLYVGAGVTGYVFPNFGVTASLNFTNVNKAFQETDLGLQGEYLISEEIPVSGFAGYTYSDFSNGGGTAHTVFVGLRLYTNTVGGTTLVERQRNGTVSSVAGFGPLGLSL